MIKNTIFFLYFINFPVAWNIRIRILALVISVSIWWMTELGMIIPDDKFLFLLLTIWYSTLIISFPCLRWWSNSSSWHLKTFILISLPYLILSDSWCIPNMYFLLQSIELPTCHPDPPFMFVFASSHSPGNSLK